MNKRYVFSVYKLTIRTQDIVEVLHFSTFKEAKLFGEAYKESHVDAQIVSIKEEKVYSRSSQHHLNVQ